MAERMPRYVFTLTTQQLQVAWSQVKERYKTEGAKFCPNCGKQQL